MRRRGEGSKPYLPRVQEVRKPSESRSMMNTAKGFRLGRGEGGRPGESPPPSGESVATLRGGRGSP
jgi:hypothetical protein